MQGTEVEGHRSHRTQIVIFILGLSFKSGCVTTWQSKGHRRYNHLFHRSRRIISPSCKSQNPSHSFQVEASPQKSQFITKVTGLLLKSHGLSGKVFSQHWWTVNQNNVESSFNPGTDIWGIISNSDLQKYIVSFKSVVPNLCGSRDNDLFLEGMGGHKLNFIHFLPSFPIFEIISPSNS